MGGLDNRLAPLVKCLRQMTKTTTLDATAPPSPRAVAEDALLDAAERLLVESGYAAITTRRLAEEAGVNHGLVHYYFGSMENVLVQALERFTARLIERQRAMYAAEGPFLEKWRRRWRTSRPTRGYQKIWLELQALAWNRPELRERVARVTAEWRTVLTEAFAKARTEYGIEMPLAALVSLVMTFNEGIMLERLFGIDEGHAELLSMDRRRCSMAIAERTPTRSRRARAIPTRRATSSATACASSTRSTASGEPTVLLLPTWSIVHSRHWKMQIPYLARHCRVVTFDGRGNGRSDRPAEPRPTPSASSPPTRSRCSTRPATERAVLVALSLGAQRALLLAAEHPERVDGAVFIAPGAAARRAGRRRERPYPFDEELDTDEGWAKYNRHYWLRDYRGFLEFFFSQMFTEPHSTKQIEDAIGWGLETTPETLDRDTAARPVSARRRHPRALPRASAARCS